MKYINAEMHQIRFRLGQTPLGKLTYSTPPDLLTGFKGILLLRGGNGREDGRGRGVEKEKGAGEGEREGRRDGGAWGGGRREEEWIEGINLPHGCLKTLAALHSCWPTNSIKAM